MHTEHGPASGARILLLMSFLLQGGLPSLAYLPSSVRGIPSHTFRNNIICIFLAGYRKAGRYRYHVVRRNLQGKSVLFSCWIWDHFETEGNRVSLGPRRSAVIHKGAHMLGDLSIKIHWPVSDA